MGEPMHYAIPLLWMIETSVEGTVKGRYTVDFVWIMVSPKFTNVYRIRLGD